MLKVAEIYDNSVTEYRTPLKGHKKSFGCAHYYIAHSIPLLHAVDAEHD